MLAGDGDGDEDEDREVEVRAMTANTGRLQGFYRDRHGCAATRQTPVRFYN